MVRNDNMAVDWRMELHCQMLVVALAQFGGGEALDLAVSFVAPKGNLAVSCPLPFFLAAGIWRWTQHLAVRCFGLVVECLIWRWALAVESGFGGGDQTHC